MEEAILQLNVKKANWRESFNCFMKNLCKSLSKSQFAAQSDCMQDVRPARRVQFLANQPGFDRIRVSQEIDFRETDHNNLPNLDTNPTWCHVETLKQNKFSRISTWKFKLHEFPWLLLLQRLLRKLQKAFDKVSHELLINMNNYMNKE